MTHSSLTLLFDGTFEGLMTAFFEAYARRPHPAAILPEAACQMTMGQRYQVVETQEEKAQRVVRGIVQMIGDFAYEKVWLAFLADIPDISQAIYQYLLWGFSIGRSIRSRLADNRVLAVDKAVSLVTREAGLLREFLRLSEMEGGVYYGEVSPRHAVLPLLMPHFADRFGIQPFVIQDCTHRMAGVAQNGDWYITPSADFSLPATSVRETSVQHLWKRFYQSIAIRERINPRLQQQLMPKKYWKHMLEMNPIPDKGIPAPYQPPAPGFVPVAPPKTNPIALPHRPEL